MSRASITYAQIKKYYNFQFCVGGGHFIFTNAPLITHIIQNFRINDLFNVDCKKNHTKFKKKKVFFLIKTVRIKTLLEDKRNVMFFFHYFKKWCKH